MKVNKRTFGWLCVGFAIVISSTPLYAQDYQDNCHGDSTCKGAIAYTEDQVREVLTDPESARFKELVLAEIKQENGHAAVIACGKVNAKNPFGGYAGYTRFFAISVLPTAASAQTAEYISIEKPKPISDANLPPFKEKSWEACLAKGNGDSGASQ